MTELLPNSPVWIGTRCAFLSRMIYTALLPCLSFTNAVNGMEISVVSVWLRTALMVIPSCTSFGGFCKVILTVYVRATGSGTGEISRTIPCTFTSGKAQKLMVAVLPGWILLISCSGKAMTASGSWPAAKVPIAWPAATTWPASTLRAVIIPLSGATKVV